MEGTVGFDVGCEKVSKDRRDYPKRGGESLPLFFSDVARNIP